MTRLLPRLLRLAFIVGVAAIVVRQVATTDRRALLATLTSLGPWVWHRATPRDGYPRKTFGMSMALEPLALRVREHVVRMAGAGGCFIGASLSCVDLLVHLYTRVLRITPDTTADPDRDCLFLSKGHDVPALYGTLAVGLGCRSDRRVAADHQRTRDA